MESLWRVIKKGNHKPNVERLKLLKLDFEDFIDQACEDIGDHSKAFEKEDMERLKEIWNKG